MPEQTAFSTSGEEAITRTIDVKVDTTADQLASDEFNRFYEIERTAEELIQGDYKRIALQFPDELLHDSVPIYRRLKPRIGAGRELYVLADTSYGSCCVDEVAAQHVDADAMVHYGYACMSQTSRLPVIYVFGHKPIDPTSCVDRVMEVYKTNVKSQGKPQPSVILLKHDVVYTHQAENILKGFQKSFAPAGIEVVYSKIPTSTHPTTSKADEQTDRKSSDPPLESDLHSLQNYSIIYIGPESLGLTNLLMTNALAEVYSYDPLTGEARLESSRTNRLLMRRYAVVQKARDSDVFAILVGTLGVASYLPLIRHIRTLLARNRKKSYTISVGKLNPSKLGNFLEIECFILVACPENSLVESKEFLRPIVTPYELEIALQVEQSWTGRYVLDFEQLLAESAKAPPGDQTSASGGDDEEVDPDQPIFSLVTGTYRHAKRYGGDPSLKGPEGSSAMVLRNKDNAVAKLTDSAAGEFLQSRSYQGLETRIGEDAPSVLEQGRSGIARGYQDDHK